MGTLSTLLTSTTLFAQEKDCKNGVCFATFSKPAVIKTFKQEQKKLINLEMSNELDKSITIVLDGELITVFPSYEMLDAEIYPLEDEIVIVEDIQKIEDIILDKSKLKDSLYYCENEKHPEFNEFSDIYQCV
jgi:hypothetical protein